MTVLLHINVVRSMVPLTVFRKLAEAIPTACTVGGRIVPEIDEATGWHCRVPLDDPRAQRVIRLLLRHELIAGEPLQWKHTKPGLTLFLSRRYSDDELEDAAFLQLTGVRHGETFGRSAGDGRSIANALSLKRLVSATACTSFPSVLVREVVRQRIQESDLLGFEFMEVIPERRTGRKPGEREAISWESVCEPWWELRSSVTMPPLSPSVRILYPDPAWGPFDPRQIVGIHEGAFRGGELHYIKSDIEQMSPFDFAMTWEHVGAPPFGDRLVVSHRVYQLFKQHRFKARWAPVRLDG